jgi:hypothetical protein
MLHTYVASKNKDMNEMNDAHAYEMQCNYGSQTPKVLQGLCHPLVLTPRLLAPTTMVTI